MRREHALFQCKRLEIVGFTYDASVRSHRWRYDIIVQVDTISRDLGDNTIAHTPKVYLLGSVLQRLSSSLILYLIKTLLKNPIRIHLILRYWHYQEVLSINISNHKLSGV